MRLPGPTPIRLRTRRPYGAAAGFWIAVAIPPVLALDGGSFDLVARQRVGALAWGAIAIGLVLGVLPRSRPASASLRLLAGFGAFAGLTASGLLGTDSAERTYDEFSRVVAYTGALALPILALDRRTWRAAARGLVLGALLIPALAVASRLAPTWFDESAAQLLGSDRLDYPFDYWNSLASWAAIAATMGLAMSVESRRAWVRAGCLAGSVIAFVAVYLTYSRGGLLATAAGACFVLFMARRTNVAILHVGAAGLGALAAVVVIRGEEAIARGEGSEGALVVAMAVIGAAVACAYLAARTRPPQPGSARRRRGLVRSRGAPIAIGVVLAGSVAAAVLAGGEEAPVVTPAPGGADPAARLITLEGNRPDYWASALRAFETDPVAGLGPGTFSYWWTDDGESSELVVDAHSLYLEQLAELGLPGFLAIVGLMGGCCWIALWLPRGSGAAAATALPGGALVYVMLAGVDWLWESPAVTMMVLAAAGTGAAAASEPRRRAAIGAPPPRWLGHRRLIVAVATSVIAVGVLVPGWVMSSALSEARESRAAGDFERAAAALSRASQAAPWATSPYAEAVSLELARDRPRRARSAAVEAAEREPKDFTHFLVLAEVEEDLARGGAARAALRRARLLAPRATVLNGAYARDLERRIERLPR